MKWKGKRFLWIVIHGTVLIFLGLIYWLTTTSQSETPHQETQPMSESKKLSTPPPITEKQSRRLPIISRRQVLVSNQISNLEPKESPLQSNDIPVAETVIQTTSNLAVIVTGPGFKKYFEKIPGTDIPISMVPIPGGKMTLGSPRDEPGRESTDLPLTEVNIKPFFLGQFEISWEQLMPYIVINDSQTNPANDLRNEFIDNDGIPHPIAKLATLYRSRGEKGYPAIGVSYYLAITYCKWLGQKTGKNYRLPREEEWEFACRGGSKSAFFWGSNPSRAHEFAWFRDNANQTTHPVGQRKSNAYQLFDIVGNVMEWCAKEDPKLPGITRGGAWSEPVERIRCAARMFEKPEWNLSDMSSSQGIWWLSSADFVGFRIACSYENDGPEKLTSTVDSAKVDTVTMALFKKLGCAGCHGEDGRGKTKLGIKMGARDYTDPAVKAQLSDDSMIRAINNGVIKEGKKVMNGVPSGILSDVELKALVNLMKSF